MKIILGSQSKQRQQLLKDMGYEFEIISPDVHEKSVRDNDPRQLVLKVARLKSDAVVHKTDKDSIVITSDSIVLANGEIREKAKDKAQAYKWLEELSKGSPQTVVTSLVITNTKTGERLDGVEQGDVIFNPIPEQDAQEFVESGAVFNHAGAFAIQNPIFTNQIKEVKGEMETIIGLPKKLTSALLAKFE